MKIDKTAMKKYWLPGLILLTVLILVIAMTAGNGGRGGTAGDHDGLTRPQSEAMPTVGGETAPQDPTGHTVPDKDDPMPTDAPDAPTGTEPPVTPEEPVVLEDGLLIEQVGVYSGMYVEDGSGEICPDVMMVVLRNGSGKDLQLARIELTVGEETYHFQCTNLPAGGAAVLLDQDRKTSVSARPDQAEITMSAFFDSSMELCADKLEIRGQQGNLTVTNVSGADISGDIYVYYKFHAADYFYGGITFRVAVRGGLKAGESSQLIAGHYTPDGCKIVQVTYGP